MLAEMAVERGTTLPDQVAAMGIVGTVQKRYVSNLRSRIKAMPRLPADSCAGGGNVLWSDLKALLDASPGALVLGPLMVAEQLRGLPPGKHRAELWRRVEQYCLDQLPPDVSPEAVLTACGAASVMDDLPGVWTTVRSIRRGDRSMLPAPEPETAEWNRARLLISRLPAAIKAKGNGTAGDMLEQLEVALAERDAAVILQLAEQVGISEVAT
jgi:hypothetical protein